MKKLDVFAWYEVTPGTEVAGIARNLELRCSAPSALFVSSQGYEVLAGYGTDFDLAIADEYTFRLEGGKGVRCFVKGNVFAQYQSRGQVFTNCDRLPHQSGAVLEVRRALREQQFRHQQFMREARQAAEGLRRMRADLAASISPGEGIQGKLSPGDAAKPDTPAAE